MELLLGRHRKAIANMFSKIALRYDLLNHLLSLGQDSRWRRFAVKWLPITSIIVDIGTGTGDFAFTALRVCPNAHVIGIDLSEKMLYLARRKTKAKYEMNCQWLIGDGLNLPLQDEIADAVLCAFTIRNLNELEQGLVEMVRVLKNDGIALILEFCPPSKGWFGVILGLFIQHVIPFLGKLISDPIAYSYLAASIYNFLPAEKIANLIRHAGFRRVDWVKLTFGVTTLFRAVK